jgi:hypothetical protein
MCPLLQTSHELAELHAFESDVSASSGRSKEWFSLKVERSFVKNKRLFEAESLGLYDTYQTSQFDEVIHGERLGASSKRKTE